LVGGQHGIGHQWWLLLAHLHIVWLAGLVQRCVLESVLLLNACATNLFCIAVLLPAAQAWLLPA
jgi:hypothetical protein